MAYQYQPAMVPPRKSNTTKVVLIVVGVVLALCCVGGVIGGFALYHAVREATGPARTTVDSYAGALVARDYPTAYGQLCGQVRGRVSQEDFARQQAAQPALTGYEIVGLNVQNTNGRVYGSANVRFTPQSGTSQTQVYRLVKEDGSWRICE
ncbi:Rv0361 family membrane protein [Micromonospora sp. NPDC003776]